MFPIPGDSRKLAALRHDVDMLYQILGNQMPGVSDFFPAKITGGQSGLHSWTEEYNGGTGASARNDKPSGRVGTVTGINGATTTWQPARMPDGSTLTASPSSPVKVWLRKTIYLDASGANYEIFLNQSSSTVLFGQDSATTGLPTNTGYPTGTTIYSSLTSGISISGIMTSGQFFAGKYHFAWYAAGAVASPAGAVTYGNSIGVGYGAATTVYGPSGAYLVPATSTSSSALAISVTGDGWVHNFVDSSVAFYVTASGFKTATDGAVLNQVTAFSVMFAKFS